MTKKVGYKDLIAAAEAEVQSISADEVEAKAADGSAVLVDIRDVRELQRDGMIEGARHAPRGMLEFWIDEESPYHKDWFAEDKLYVFYCAAAWRSLLAAQLGQNMGLRTASLEGGLGEWKKLGKAVTDYNK